MSGEPSRRLDRLLAAAAASFVAALAGSLVALGVRVTEEDGFYYLKIAQNLASGHGSTFDGLHPTSGYQPLWLLVLVPVFWLRPSAAAAILIATATQAVLLALAAALLYTLARTWLSPAAALLAVMSWILLAYRPGLSGVEFALLSLLACALALVLALRFHRRRTRGHPLERGDGSAAGRPRARAHRPRAAGGARRRADEPAIHGAVRARGARVDVAPDAGGGRRVRRGQ